MFSTTSTPSPTSFTSNTIPPTTLKFISTTTTFPPTPQLLVNVLNPQVTEVMVFYFRHHRGMWQYMGGYRRYFFTQVGILFCLTVVL